MKTYGEKLLIFLTLIMLAGCAGRPTTMDLPVSHPANPRAEATPYTPPPNIFQEDVGVVELQPAPDTPMTHDQHGKAGSMQMNDQMDHKDMKQKGGKEPVQLKKEKSGHQHEEHKQ